MALKDLVAAAIEVDTPINDLTFVKLAAGAKTPPHVHKKGYIVVPLLSGTAERVIERNGHAVSTELVELEALVPYYVDATIAGHTTAFRNTSGRISIFQKLVPCIDITQPQPELELQTIDIMTQNGARSFTVEVARSIMEKVVGLMFRPSLAPSRGMIFVWPEPMKVAMYMRNVLVPLDFIFIDKNHKISRVYENATPGSSSAISSVGEVSLTLEVSGGTVARLGIAVGDMIQ